MVDWGGPRLLWSSARTKPVGCANPSPCGLDERGSFGPGCLALTLSLLLVEAVEQFGPLALGQAAERLRVSDAAVGEDPAGFDRADLR